MHRGYIRLWRKIMDTAIWENPLALQVFIWCVMRAAHEPKTVTVKTGRGYTEVQLKRGQFVTGRKTAGEQLKRPESTVWRTAKTLEKAGYVNIESNTRFSVITVCNYELYQSQPDEDADESGQRTGQRSGQPSEQRSGHKEEDKKIKEDKKRKALLEAIVYPDGFRTQAVQTAISLWLDYKHGRRQTYKDPARQMSLLIKRDDYPTPEAFVKAVEWSIGQNYQGIYPPPEGRGNERNAGTVLGETPGRVRRTDWSQIPNYVPPSDASGGSGRGGSEAQGNLPFDDAGGS